MKVVVIGTDRSLFDEDSAARRRIFDQAALFEELHLVVFAEKSLGLRKEKIGQNIWLYPTNSRSRWHYVFDAAALGRRICREKFFTKGKDIISAQDPFECGLTASRVSRDTGLPFQIQIHTDFLSPYFRKSSVLNYVRYFISKRVLPQASGIRVVSERIAVSIRKGGLKLKGEVSVLPVYHDPDRLKPEGEVFDLHRKYPQFDFILLGVGRLAPEKNFKMAIQLLASVLPVRPNSGLFLVGDGPERSKLESIAVKLGVRDRVVFVPHTEALYSFYKTADVFLVPSIYEGYGLVFIEAASFGCPMVVSDVGVAKEVVPEEFAEFVCPVGDFDCFREKIQELAHDHEKRERYSVELAASAGAHTLNRQAYMQKYFSLLDKASKIL